MNQPKTDYSFVVRQTFDTETGLVSNVITLDEVYQLLDVMNKQGERLHLENERLRKDNADCWSYNHAVTRDNTALCRLRDEMMALGDAMAKESHTPEAQAWRAMAKRVLNRYEPTPVDKNTEAL